MKFMYNKSYIELQEGSFKFSLKQFVSGINNFIHKFIFSSKSYQIFKSFSHIDHRK